MTQPAPAPSSRFDDPHEQNCRIAKKVRCTVDAPCRRLEEPDARLGASGRGGQPDPLLALGARAGGAGRAPERWAVRGLSAGGNRIRTIGPALAKGLSSRLLPKRDAGPISWMGSLSTGRLAGRRWPAAGPLSTAVSFLAAVPSSKESVSAVNSGAERGTGWLSTRSSGRFFSEGH